MNCDVRILSGEARRDAEGDICGLPEQNELLTVIQLIFYFGKPSSAVEQKLRKMRKVGVTGMYHKPKWIQVQHNYLRVRMLRHATLQ